MPLQACLGRILPSPLPKGPRSRRAFPLWSTEGREKRRRRETMNSSGLTLLQQTGHTASSLPATGKTPLCGLGLTLIHSTVLLKPVTLNTYSSQSVHQPENSSSKCLSWRDGPTVKACTTLTEGLDLTPNTHVRQLVPVLTPPTSPL